MEIKSGVWQHYKGKRYLVLGVARHTENNEELVVYVPLYEHPAGGLPLQVRPVKMWLQKIKTGPFIKQRFSYEGPATKPAKVKKDG